MKSLLRSIIFAATFGAFSTSQAAVHFNGLVGATNLGGVGGPAQTNAAVCHVWIRPMKEETMVILQGVDPVSYHESFILTTILLEDGMKMDLTLFSPDGDTFELISSNTIPIDGIWHEIGFAIDTDFPSATFIYDYFRRPIDQNVGLFSGTPGWQFKIAGQVWRQGGAYTNSAGVNIPLLMIGGKPYGTAIEPFFGDMEQLYCDFRDDAYLDMATVGPGHGFSEVKFSNGVPFAAGPVDIGKNCEAIFGGAAFLPPICMQGTPLNFLNNQGGTTVFTEFGGIITQSTSSPFDIWHP